jgi:hypothetical protein
MKTRFTEKKFWYHCSKTNLGDSITLSPKKNIEVENEPEESRLCVAPSAAHCLTAISFPCCEKLYIYKTVRKVKAKYPYDVCDAFITEEKWLKRSIRFKLVATIDCNKYIKISNKTRNFRAGDKTCFRIQKRHLKKLQTLLNKDGIFIPKN